VFNPLRLPCRTGILITSTLVLQRAETVHATIRVLTASELKNGSKRKSAAPRVGFSIVAEGATGGLGSRASAPRR
jgi:hypothetical protein